MHYCFTGKEQGRQVTKVTRGTTSNINTDNAGSSIETYWAIPHLRNTRLSDGNPTQLNHSITADQQSKEKWSLSDVLTSRYHTVR